MRPWTSLGGLVLAAACADEPPAPAAAEWPVGTVVVLHPPEGDPWPIGLDEVDGASVWIERIQPQASDEHLRRLAFTQIVLPRALAQVVAPGAHERALAMARAKLEELRTGDTAGPPDPGGALGELVEGTWQTLGIAVWGTAMDLVPGEWSEPIEDVGRIVLARLIERHEAPLPLAIPLTVDQFVYPLFPGEGGAGRDILERAYDTVRLEIIDPKWREIVPEYWQYRMGAHSE